MDCVEWEPNDDGDYFFQGMTSDAGGSCEPYTGSPYDLWIEHPSECNNGGLFTPPCPPPTPLILDLDGDGVKADTYAFFDHEGDGFSELSGWAEVDDGFLVWDRNNDGVINDGSELFGDNTVLANGNKAADGFAALADLDSNGDGVVDASDTNWANLKVLRWTDSDGDGVKDTLELSGLADLDIESLNTGFANSNHVDSSGNEHRQVGSYTKADGTTATMTDVWLWNRKRIARYDDSDIPEHSTAIGALPDLRNSGRVYGLRDAMALDDATDADGNSRLTAPYYSNNRTETRSLREMVEAFTATNADGSPNLDKTAREALATKILSRWAGAEGAVSRDYWVRTSLSYTTPQKVAVVEAFTGEQYWEGRSYRNPGYSAGQLIEGSYLRITEWLYGNLMLQTHLKDLNDAITVSLKSGAAEGSTDIDDNEISFAGAKTILDGESNARLGEFLRSLAAVYGQSDWVIAGMKATATDWVYEYEYRAEYLVGAVFDGENYRQNDYEGNNDSNVFQTTDGGADVLKGRSGDDIYHLDYGTGHDRIEEQWRSSDYDGDANDVIKLAPGIALSKVILSRTRDDLIVALLDANGLVSDSLRVVDFYARQSVKVEKVVFSDGTEWDLSVLQSVQFSSGQGSAGADTYDGSLDGQPNVLQGGRGSDVYILGSGSGNDTIDESSYNTGGGGNDVDVVRLASGITVSQVSLSRDNFNLFINLSDASGTVTDTLTVKNYYVSDAAKVEKVVFSDGTEWDLSVLQSVPFSSGRGSAGADIYDGSLDGQSNVLQGGMGSDVYILGRDFGNDTIDEAAYNTGGGGNDVDVVRLKSGLTASDVELLRTRDDLIIRVLSTDGSTVDSTLTVKNYYVSDAAKIERVELSDGTKILDADDFANVVLSDAGSGNDTVIAHGGDVTDVLGGSNGGNDTLRGGGGGDVYLFGGDSDNDVVDEGYRNFGGLGDTVRLKSGIAASQVSLSRDSFNLLINLSDAQGTVTDTLTVKNYYVSDAAKIERLELWDGTKVWDTDDFAAVNWTPPSYATGAELSGTIRNESLYGEANLNDVFDGDVGGNDELYGYGGDDVYWLGAGTGNDTIREYYNNSGDAGDVIKLKSGIGTADVRLLRSSNGNHLYVQLLGAVDANGVRAVTDSLTVANHYTDDSAKVERVEFEDGAAWDANDFILARISGTSRNESLHGEDNLNDVFDGDVGGNDELYGYGGDDVYWLGAGTGNDTIREYYNNSGDAGDVIKLKSGIGTADVRLLRSSDGNHLYVQLLGAVDANGVRAVTDSLTVVNYYTDDSAKIERVEFEDGTAWDANDFILARISGTSRNESLHGEDNLNDVFDGDVGGNDELYGYGGDDVYWLGAGTGNDTIREYYNNSGDAGDVIKLKSGIGTADVRLLRSSDGNHLYVQLLGAVDANGVRAVTDSLTVVNYYTDDSAKVERVEFEDGTAWDANDFILARISGTSRNESLHGEDNLNDVFDGDVGGNDELYGYGGDDVYWLGAGTGNDTIREYYNNSGDAGDVIKLKSGIGTADVRLLRSSDGNHLYVQLLGAVDANGVRAVTDSLTVVNYYTDDSAKVERVEFEDGTAWDANDFILARISGTSRNESLHGEDNLNDVFDGDVGGNDELYGYGGDDVYWLGAGTGNDTIREYYNNSGDAGDVIKLKSGIGTADVRLLRSSDGNHLYVQLLGAVDANGVRAVTDSLTVANYYTDDSAKVERVEFEDGTAWDANDFILARISGTSRNESLYGEDNLNDVFDGDVGGNDELYGYGGDDVYWLGAGTGNDTIREYSNNSGDAGDVIKLKSGIGTADVRLLRSSNGNHLYVQLLGAVDANGVRAVTDSLTVANYYTDDTAKVERLEFEDGTAWDANDFILARISGTSRNESLYGEDNLNDVFDGDAGGNDELYGYGGDDVYWLGAGTGNDTIREYSNNSGDAGDVIKLKSGIGTADVRLLRSSNGNHLYVQLLGAVDANGVRAVTDSLTVANYYTDDTAKVERLEFEDGTAWDANDFILARISGTSRNESLYGEDNLNDVFDGDAGGNDELYGYGGDDVYWLGAGTGNDTIREYSNNSGDAGDVIKLKSGIGTADVRLLRSSNGNHLYVQLLGAVDANGVRAVTDSLTVANHYTDDSAKIERVEFEDGTAWDANDFILARISGTSRNESLYGEDNLNDVFDGDVGGNDELYGYGGDDVYWLGAGTGNDTIREYYNNSGDAGDVIKLKSGIGTADVRLLRSSNGNHLYVQLLGAVDANGVRAVTDSLTVANYYTDDSAKIERVEFEDGATWSTHEFSDVLTTAWFSGTSGDDTLEGTANQSDVFDSVGGGDDTLRGLSGDDTYWLGIGTGDDTIQEHYNNSGDSGDKIKIHSGIGTADVRLLRSSNGNDLYVQLLGAADTNGDRAVTDSLTVENYYTNASAKIESIEFADGTVWGTHEFSDVQTTAWFSGTSGDDNWLPGTQGDDIYDTNTGGNDRLLGLGGNDTYWLGYGTDHDTILDWYLNASGDTDDKIKIHTGISSNSVRLTRSGNDLVIQLLDPADANGGRAINNSLTVNSYYTKPEGKIESIEFADGTVWSTSYIELEARKIAGTSGDDNWLSGTQGDDIYDTNTGGNDRLLGLGGNDTYWLGYGTDHDTILDWYLNASGDTDDKIKIHTGISSSSVLLTRNGNDLVIQLLDPADANGGRAINNSLTVNSYYTKPEGKIESIEFADGTVWNTSYIELEARKIAGTSGDDNWLSGTQGDDIYDTNTGGNDRLLGLGGNDTYWLGYGTDHDTILDWYLNANGDTDDKIKIHTGISSSSVLLTRNGNDLVIQLLDPADANGGRAINNSLTVNSYYTKPEGKIESIEFADGTVWGTHEFSEVRTTAWLKGTSGDDTLEGTANQSDVFDSVGGGDDTLRGLSGDDVYWLGYGTDHDTIQEHYNNSGDSGDKVKIHTGISSSSVLLTRTGNDLVIQLLDPADANGRRAINNSLTVNAYYTKPEGKIESIEFADGTVWGTHEFSEVRTTAWLKGASGNDTLEGTANQSDVFDSVGGGDDTLRGLSGDDTYWLGYGTDHDTIQEYYNNSGDSGDKVKIHTGIGTDDIRLVHSSDDDDLIIQILDSSGSVSDTLTIENYYTDASAKIESIAFADGTVWNTSYIEREVRIVGTSGNDRIVGTTGDDILWGLSGDDTYWLGVGTGDDTIQEYYNNSGDNGDKVNIQSGIGAANVRLLRSSDDDLIIQILDNSGSVSDTLTVENHYIEDSAKIESIEFADGTAWGTHEFSEVRTTAWLKGTSGNDTLEGTTNQSDVFDSVGGGDDTLRGLSGDDVYWLGYGTDHDTIQEHYNNSGDAGDKVKIHSGIGTADVRLLRSSNGNDLYVQLLGAADTNGDRAVTDSLMVEYYYTDASAKIESIEFADGATWSTHEFNDVQTTAWFSGTSGDDNWLPGTQGDDIYDANTGGNDRLLGLGGNDTYWLGYGTDHDTILDWYLSSGDTNDKIKIHTGISSNSVRLVRSGNDLVVQLLDPSDANGRRAVNNTLTINAYYTNPEGKIESIEFADGTVWDTSYIEREIRIVGTSGDDNWLPGTQGADIYDTNTGGNDRLLGLGGNDTYRLGRGTDHDTILDWYLNASGDTGDRIKVDTGISSSSVRLTRTGNDLVVQLLDPADANGRRVVNNTLTINAYYTKPEGKIESIEFADGTVWNTSYIELEASKISGTSGDDNWLPGTQGDDIYDANTGGNDRLLGLGGNDTYWLGYGTDHDTILDWYNNNSGDAGDVIKVDTGISSNSVRLVRSGNDLVVQLLDPADANGRRAVNNTLTINAYYTKPEGKIESIEFADGTEWDTSYIEREVRIVGTSGDDNWLPGTQGDDIYDTNTGGNDRLLGLGGNDTYWLGRGTDHDTILDWYNNNSGDAGDVIKVDTGIALTSIRLSRTGNDLVIKIMNSDGTSSNSLRVERHYTDDTAKIEKIKAGDEVLLSSQYTALIDEMSLFENGTSGFSSVEDIYGHYWQDAGSITTPG